MKKSSSGNEKRNGKDFWCAFRTCCSYSCIVDDVKSLPKYPLTEEIERVKKKFEKCLDKYVYSKPKIQTESKPLSEAEKTATLQFSQYLLRLKLKGAGLGIDIPSILEEKIEKMKNNRPLLVTLSHYKGPRKVLKSLKII